MPNPVVRWQIISPEPDQAASFYQKLFAWKLTQANALGYRELHSGHDAGIDGGVWPAPPGVKGFVQLFVEVPDLDNCLDKAMGLGAQVLIRNPCYPTETRWPCCSTRRASPSPSAS